MSYLLYFVDLHLNPSMICLKSLGCQTTFTEHVQCWSNIHWSAGNVYALCAFDDNLWETLDTLPSFSAWPGLYYLFTVIWHGHDLYIAIVVIIAAIAILTTLLSLAIRQLTSLPYTTIMGYRSSHISPVYGYWVTFLSYENTFPLSESFIISTILYNYPAWFNIYLRQPLFLFTGTILFILFYLFIFMFPISLVSHRLERNSYLRYLAFH